MRIMMWLLLLLVMCLSPPVVEASIDRQRTCRYIYDNSVDTCRMKAQIYNVTRLYSTNNSQLNSKRIPSCPPQEVCGKAINITRLHVHGNDMSGQIFSKIMEMLQHCCGECAQYIFNDKESDPEFELAHMDVGLVEDSDIIFPVVGRQSLRSLYGFHFIPMFQLPGSYYFTLEISRKEMVINIIMACLSMWPLLVICMLWAIIAGFFIWILEMRHNSKQFPKPFLSGLFEGFWWSFVSMTTVGYGDKAPKRFPGRIFAVIWILIGITISSMYIGGLAGTIYSATSPSGAPDMNGLLVAGCKHQIEDSTLIAQHGGIFYNIDEEDPILGVIEMHKKLAEGVFAGFVLSKTVYHDYYYNEDKKYEKLKEHIKNNIHTTRTDLSYKGEQLISGILVSSESVYRFFVPYFENNWLQIQACITFHFNAKAQMGSRNEPSHFEGLFYDFFKGTVITMGILFGIGCVIELHRKRTRRVQRMNGGVDLLGPYACSRERQILC